MAVKILLFLQHFGSTPLRLTKQKIATYSPTELSQRFGFLKVFMTRARPKSVDRQIDVEPRAFVELACCEDHAVMIFHYFLDNCESDSGARINFFPM
jgi:hypothetical protein